jgi:hypothetical protein
MEIQIPANGPNQYETPCTVEVSHANGRTRLYRFSDFQLAYMWVQDYIGENQDDWRMTPFQEAADELTQKFVQSGMHAFVLVADTRHTQISISYGVLSFQ